MFFSYACINIWYLDKFKFNLIWKGENHLGVKLKFGKYLSQIITLTL